MTLTDWGAILSVVIAAYALYNTIKDKRHSQPLDDYKQALEIAKAAAESVKDLQGQVDALRAGMERKDKIILEWALGIRKLIHQMKTANPPITPCWEPDPITLPRTEE
jgi:hypothetical protein